MATLRAVGRSMMSIHLLVFNMGKSDFREKHLATYALRVQASLSIAGLSASLRTSSDMFRCIGALVTMRGIVSFIRRVCLALPSVHSDGSSRKDWTKRQALRLTLQTLLAHKCWRQLPLLAAHLPGILIDGSFRGVKLDARRHNFLEPGALHAQVAGAAAQREARFVEVLGALDALRQFAQRERQHFTEMSLTNSFFFMQSNE